MEKKTAVRKYLFNDATLVVKANNIVTTARRDATEFAARSITEAAVFKPLEDAIDVFADLPTDEELEGIKMELTETKHAKADAVLVQVRTILTAAENVFGEGSAKLRRFGAKGVSEMSDPELLKCAKRVARTTNSFLAALAAEGVTTENVTNLIAATNAFDEAIDDQLDAINDRDIAVETRVEAGNDIYKRMMKLANTGQDIWVSTNEAKYNDYIVNNTITGDKETTPVTPVA